MFSVISVRSQNKHSMTKRVSCRFDAVVVTVVADVATVVAILDADDAFNLRETQCKNELHCFENTS